MIPRYDVIVVGAGTAGCVLAARLSSAQGCRVLLIEAGPDYPTPSDLPSELAVAMQPAFTHDWGYQAEPDDQGRIVPLPRARVVGGCSATNAGFMLRGWPADYDQWASLGNPGWSFDELLPTLRAVEADADIADEWHGRHGPIPIHRDSVADLAPAQRAFLQAAVAAGHREVSDHNRPGAVGVGPAPRNSLDGLRMSTALTHLAAARSRPNLSIRPRTMVDRVQICEGRAGGVRLVGGEVVAADRTILSAGSYSTPAILMRSGIGDAPHLRQIGVDVLLDLPGVGANLIDHPLVAVDVPSRVGLSGAIFQVMLVARSPLAGADEPPDLHLFLAGPFETEASTSGGVLAVVTGLLRIRSRGQVRLRSADPLQPPRISPGHLREPEDLQRMIDATIEARRLTRIRPLADFVLGDEINPGAATGDEDRDGLARSIISRVGSYHHPVGTCAMGSDPETGAVVSSTGAVHGVAGLWVADASVMPTIPTANTHLSTVMVAERLAGWLVAT